jgi:hypothetical protein
VLPSHVFNSKSSHYSGGVRAQLDSHREPRAPILCPSSDPLPQTRRPKLDQSERCASKAQGGCTPASLKAILTEDVPIHDVLAFPPAPIVAALALEAADSSFSRIDFVPHSFVTGPVEPGAALYSLEGDFGFSPPNGNPEVGHEVKLINFDQESHGPISLSFQNFARNTTPAIRRSSALITRPDSIVRPMSSSGRTGAPTSSIAVPYATSAPCELRAWFGEHDPLPQTPAPPGSIVGMGIEAGILARGLIPDGVLIDCDFRDYQRVLNWTADLMATPDVVAIFEAGFAHSRCLIRTDILERRDGGWCLGEVKSSTKVKDEHLVEVALQVWVLQQCGVDLADVQLILVNPEYVRGEDGPIVG